VLLGCAFNLRYLRSYGFKTFDSWWDESYDVVIDPVARLQAVVSIIRDISAMSDTDLESMLQGMQHVLDYNYELFYSRRFVDATWNELAENLAHTLARL
jgi:hypothetical protein